MKEKQTQVKTINVTDGDKVKVNELKAKLNLTDKELVSVLLEVVGMTDETVVKSVIETVVVNKQKAKILARIAKLQEQIAAESKALDPVETPVAEVEAPVAE